MDKHNELRVVQMDATDFAVAELEFKKFLGDIGASPRANVVCMKGYGSRLDEKACPFRDATLDAIQDADVLVWDGDWLKAQSFTSVIADFLRAKPARRAVGFRKASGNSTNVIKSWTDPTWEKLEYPADQLPNVEQLGLLLVKPELVTAACDELVSLGVEPKHVDNTALGYLTSKVARSARAVAVGGGDTCVLEAQAWARVREKLSDGSWCQNVSVPQWTVLPIGRQGKEKWETPDALMEIVGASHLAHDVANKHAASGIVVGCDWLAAVSATGVVALFILARRSFL